MAVGGFGCCLLVALLALVGVLNPDSSSGPWQDFLITVLIGVAFFAVIWIGVSREARRRVTISSEGIEIVGLWGSRSVELADAGAFGVEHAGRQNQRAVLWTRDGRRIRCFAPIVPGAGGLDVDVMNAALEHHRA